MESEYGSLTIVCKQCKAVYVLQDVGNMERMTGYICPGCGKEMCSRELARLKAIYYMRLSNGLKMFPSSPLKNEFDCRIDLGIYYEK